MSLHKEISFEDEICEHLAAHGWLYAEGDAAKYDRARALFPDDVWRGCRRRSRRRGRRSTRTTAPAPRAVLLDRLRKQLDQRGTLDVLRHGIELLGLRQPIALAQFKPALAMNPDILARYAANRLRVVRQVRYSLAQRELHRPGAVPQRPAGGDRRAEDRLHAERRATPSTSIASTASRDPKGQAAEPLLSLPQRRAGAFRGEQQRSPHDHAAGRAGDALPAVQPGRPRRRRATR